MSDLIDFLEDPSKEIDGDFSNLQLEKIQSIRQKVRNEDARNGMDKVLLKNMQDSQAHTFEIIHDLKNSLRDTVKESKSTQFLAKSMFILTFLLGFGMFIIAIYFAFLEKQFFTIVFGGIGLATIITFFIANPPLKIQDSRSNYAQLNVAVLTWFNDFIEKSNLSVNNSQILQLLLKTDERGNLTLTAEEAANINREIINNATSISNQQIENTRKLLLLIEDVAEPSKKTVGIIRKMPESDKEPNT